MYTHYIKELIHTHTLNTSRKCANLRRIWPFATKSICSILSIIINQVTMHSKNCYCEKQTECFGMSVTQSIHLPIRPPTHPSIHPPSINISVIHLTSVCLSIYPSLYHSFSHPRIHLSTEQASICTQGIEHWAL